MNIAILYKRPILWVKLVVLVAILAPPVAIAENVDASRKLRNSVVSEDSNHRLVQSAAFQHRRKLTAVIDKDDDDSFKIDLKDPRLAGEDLSDLGLDLEKEDKEDAALLSKTKDIFEGKHIDDDENEKPLSLKHLGPLKDDLGLSDEDLKDMDDIETGKVTLKTVRSMTKRNPDERPLEVPPPPGMVADPHAMKKVAADLDPDRPSEADKPPLPREPTDLDTGSTKKLADKRAEGIMTENVEYERRVLDLSRKLDAAQHEVSSAKKEAAKAQREIIVLKLQHERSKHAFQRSLDSSREEENSEKEEMTATIKEQKRAFDELFEEKQLLSQMLSDEQKTLKELQDKIQHPDLGLWVRQRAEKAAILVETPETDAVKYYARKYMAPKVTKMKHRLEVLEKRVERTVDHLLPAKYGSVVAFLLSIGLVGFPIMVTMSTVVSVTKSVSLRQYVLLGNVFLTAFAAGLCIAGILLRQDPLQTLYEASETLFITLQLTTAVAFPIFLAVIGCTVFKSRDRLDAFVFGCEFVFYLLVAMNYRSRVWRPAMLGQNIETSVMMYAIYLMDFMSMTALTISSARIDEGSLAQDTDPEAGVGSKAVGINGNGPLHGSVSSRVSSLSSGLIQAAMGHGGRTGKEE